MVIRQDPQDGDPRPDALAEPLDRRLARFELLARRGKRLLVDDRPAVVLRVRELEPLGVELLGEPQDLLDAVQVLTVQHAVDRQGEPELARHLLSVRRRSPQEVTIRGGLHLQLNRRVCGSYTLRLRCRDFARWPPKSWTAKQYMPGTKALVGTPSVVPPL